MLVVSGSRNLPFDHRFFPEKWARVHFIPDLKVGVFVTLRAPNVIKCNLIFPYCWIWVT
jgi:hypothetical protein